MSINTNLAPFEKTEFDRTPSVRSIVNIATLFEILGAFALIITAIMLGDSHYAFIDIPSICSVISGLFGITVACYSFRDVGTAFSIVMSPVFYHTQHPASATLHILPIADLYRHKDLRAMEPYVPRLMNEKMLQNGLKMLINGSSVGDFNRIMQGEMPTAVRSHFRTVGVLRKATKIYPAMKLIGTLVGLVHILGNLTIQARSASAWLSPCSRPFWARLWQV
jgi:chemotaxis protein MotA